MARLLVHVEGETEEGFVNGVLAPHLYDIGFSRVSARLLGNARLRQQRGGIRSWAKVKGDITNHLKEDREAFATTMVDYYGLNSSWPGRTHASSLDFPKRSRHVEGQMLADLANDMGDGFDSRRFIPNVVMHEFEGLLFSDCATLCSAMARDDLATDLSQVRAGFTTPEEINDSFETCPSRRILSLMPEYQKPFHGFVAAGEIGLVTIRDECPLFDSWLSRIEALLTP